MSNEIRDVLFVSEQYMRETFFLSDNVQSKFILQAVRNAQDIEFQQVVGSCLYNHLKELVTNGEISESENAAYKKVIDEARMFIGSVALVQLCVVSTVHLTNAGLNRVKGGEDFEVLANDEMFEIRNYYQGEADHYKKRLQMTIYNMKDELPELDECSCNQMKANLYSAASTSLWLGGRRGKRPHNPNCC